jgi:hypothetical protein
MLVNNILKLKYCPFSDNGMMVTDSVG